jgi:hypothetical protein
MGLLLDKPGPPFSVGAANRISVRELRAATRGRFHRPGPACPRGTGATLGLGAASGHAGDAIAATVVNCGRAALGSNLHLAWEARQADGSFAPVQPPWPSTQPLYIVRPRESRRFADHVWDNLQPGEYRAALRASTNQRDLVLYAGPFQVRTA